MFENSTKMIMVNCKRSHPNHFKYKNKKKKKKRQQITQMSPNLHLQPTQARNPTESFIKMLGKLRHKYQSLQNVNLNFP